MVKSNPDGSIAFERVEYLGKTTGKEFVSDKVTPKSVEMNWTNKLKNVLCIMCNRKMTAKRFENAPHYCYKCHDEAEGVFGNA